MTPYTIKNGWLLWNASDSGICSGAVKANTICSVVARDGATYLVSMYAHIELIEIGPASWLEGVRELLVGPQFAITQD